MLTAAACGAAMVWLQGCTVAPTPQEKAARLASTLNVYEDNRIAYRARGGSRSSWGWSKDKQAVLALEMRGRLQRPRHRPRHGGGSAPQPQHHLPRHPGTEIRAEHHRRRRLQWQQRGLAGLRYAQGLHAALPVRQQRLPARPGGILTAITDADLMRSEPSRAPGSDLMNDYRAIPSAGGNLREVVFPDEPGKAELVAKLDRPDERWKQVLQRREQQQAAERAARRRARKRSRRKPRRCARVRIGTQTNCGAVFEVRLPMVGVQTMNGMQFLPLSQLYGPSANCRFVNGQYVGR